MGKSRDSQFHGKAQRRRKARDLKEQRWEDMERQLRGRLECQPEHEFEKLELEPYFHTDSEPGFQTDFGSDSEAEPEEEATSHGPDPGTWASLPPELRNHILDMASFRCENAVDYVTVSREWQPWFERETFRSIEIESHDRARKVYQFGRLMRDKNARRWAYVRNIKFNIHLWTKLFDYGLEDFPEFHNEAESNNHVFTAVMIQLLKFLASCPEWCRINLELGITSPKDSTKRDMTELGHLERHLGSLLDLRTGIALPRTPAVKRLVIQKQYHRQMSPHCLARLFNQSFVNTEFFSLQRRCRITETQTEVEYMRDFRDVLMPALPLTLRKFWFQSSFLREKWIKPHAEFLLDPDSLSEQCFSFYNLLQEQSGRFTTLSFSHPALVWPCDEGDSASHPRLIWSGEDRRIDFSLTPRFCWDPKMFQDLERVWLRAPLRIALRSDFLDQILTSAASLAASMPKLRMMGLWTDTCGLGPETVFQYIPEFENGKPMIRWSSEVENESPFSDEVISAWKATAAKHNDGKTDLIVRSSCADKVNWDQIWREKEVDDL